MTVINSVRLSSSKFPCTGLLFPTLSSDRKCHLLSGSLCFPICEMGQGRGTQVFDLSPGFTAQQCHL